MPQPRPKTAIQNGGESFKPQRERLFSECPKCGARGGCEKHGLTSTGIDLRARAEANRK